MAPDIIKIKLLLNVHDTNFISHASTDNESPQIIKCNKIGKILDMLSDLSNRNTENHVEI